MDCPGQCKKGKACYENMLTDLGTEFEILRKVPLEDIRKLAGGKMAEAISRLRMGKVKRIPGYDGQYGRIQILDKAEGEEAK
ncbi:MAG: hypothetical protein SO401_12310 [Blautia sp.]|nr:hypothetical protein [Blautia sp.]